MLLISPGFGWDNHFWCLITGQRPDDKGKRLKFVVKTTPDLGGFSPCKADVMSRSAPQEGQKLIEGQAVVGNDARRGTRRGAVFGAGVGMIWTEMVEKDSYYLGP